MDIERGRYQDWYQSWILNETDTKTSIEFSDPTILIPIPGIIPKKIRDLTGMIPRREVLLDSGLGKNIFEGQMGKNLPNYSHKPGILITTTYIQSNTCHSVLDIEWDQYRDQSQSCTLNGTDTKTGLSPGH